MEPDNQTTSDEALMRQYVQGFEEAFEGLFSRYRERLFDFLRNRLGGKKTHLTEEIFQKTWLKVHQARATFDPTRKFSTWVFTIALNCLRDEVGRAHERLIFEETADEVQSDPNLSSEESLMKVHVKTQILKALQQIPERQKEVVLLSHFEGFSSKEVAQLLGLSDGAVRQLQYRAHQNLKQILSEEEVR